MDTATNSENDSRVLKLKKIEMLETVIESVNYSQELLDVVIGELSICNELIVKGIFVSERFSDFHEIWRHVDFSQNIQSFFIYQEIETQVQSLSDILDTFEEKTQKASSTLQNMTSQLTRHLRELENVQEKCETALNIQELENLQLPDLSRLETETKAYPDLTELHHSWNDCDIYSKLNRCIETLETLYF